MTDLNTWNGVPYPEHIALGGDYIRLEPIDAEKHTQSLYEASIAQDSDTRFRYLSVNKPQNLHSQRQWLNEIANKTDPLFFAVIDKTTNKAEGIQSLMRIDAGNGVIEIGNIMWGPKLSRTRGATEALFLMANYAFGLGYRRFEWKCNNDNIPSKNAALRFGFKFEGIFRKHMVVKGKSRDTAWFAIIDDDWHKMRPEYIRWLSTDNFDVTGQQLSKLHFET